MRPSEVPGTADEVTPAELGLAKADYEHYEISGWFVLSKALQGRVIRPNDVFVEFGCGKGRVLTQAARRPFSRVVGIDISPELSRVAEANLERNSTRHSCGEAEVITGDITARAVPAT
jgi:methylase of polypeptide subunit release factors